MTMANTISLSYESENKFQKFVNDNRLQQYKQLFIQVFSCEYNEGKLAHIQQVIKNHLPQAMFISCSTKNKVDVDRVLLNDQIFILITMFEESEWRSMLEKMSTVGSFFQLIETSQQEIKRLNESLTVTEQQYRSLFENNADFIYSTDLQGNFTSVNPAFEETFGYTEDELLGLSVLSIIKEPDITKVKQSYTEILAGNKLCFHIHVPSKIGEIIPCQITIIPIIIDDVHVGFYGIGRNITKQIEIENRMKNLVYFDYHTGLPNRAQFTDKLRDDIHTAEEKNEEFALLFIDIDRFKNINDSFGHHVGDIVLKELSQRISAVLPKGAFLGRFEGDKFSLILDGKYLDNLLEIANEILAHVYQPIYHENQDFFVTGSIGVSVYPEDGRDEQTLLKHADLAMHRSKHQGGNRTTFFCPNMNKEAMDRLKLESYLRKALSKNEFHLVYQPLIDLSNGEIYGVEVLIRWQHPEIGLIPPLEFIPIAEEIGLIVEIGSWVLKTACKQVKKWHDDGLDQLSIAVNVSARQFQERNFLHIVKIALEEANLEPKYLILELTESVMLQNMDYSISVMKELQQLGVKVSIDDFGTGYSSLSYLKNLPIDTLKIDRTFINNLQLDTSDIAIVKAIITMGQGLAVKVVAEGVETEEQMNLLKELNCHYAQGYYIDKPLSVEEFESIRKPVSYDNECNSPSQF